MDGVRGVGILAVVAQHTLGSAVPIDIGYYGLAMFFALSGYLITGRSAPSSANAVSAVAGAAIAVCMDCAAVGAWPPRLLSLRSWVSLGVVSHGSYQWHGPMMRLADQVGLSGAAGGPSPAASRWWLR